MIHRVTIRACDRSASARFYDTVLAAIGVGRTGDGDHVAWRDLALEQADAGHPPTRRLHVGFAAASRERVDAFWRAGRDAGHRDDGTPGPRPQYRDDYYGAFLLDPDGNSAEAVTHGAVRTNGIVDHLWIRVRDVAASRRFYEGIAARAGLSVRAADDDFVQFTSAGGSFSLLPGTPTEHVHLAFAAAPGGGTGSLLDPDGHRVEIVAGDRG